MKKLIFAIGLMVATTGVLSAQATQPGNGKPGTNKNMPGFVDANNNGVCDSYENNTRPNNCNGQGNKGNAAVRNGQCRFNMQGCGRGNGSCAGRNSGNAIVIKK